MMDERSFALGPAVVVSRKHQIHFFDVVATDIADQNMYVSLVVGIERIGVRIAKAIGVNLVEDAGVGAPSNGLTQGSCNDLHPTAAIDPNHLANEVAEILGIVVQGVLVI